MTGTKRVPKRSPAPRLDLARPSPHPGFRLDRPLILASASPRRRTLLRRLGLRFRVEPSRTGEKSSQRDPRKLVVELALRKARDIARRRPETAVLGADTLVVCCGRILGKPRNQADAQRILGLLNGRWQEVYTGIALVLDGGRRFFTRAVRTRVLARRLPPAALRRLAGKHMDKAGAYAVQDRDDPFIERIDGDHGNVVGLPLKATCALLQRHLAR